MVHSKDTRSGFGWFDSNTNALWAWLEDHNYKVEVKGATEDIQIANRKVLEEEVEDILNRYISYKIFHTRVQDAESPEHHDYVWSYFYSCLKTYIQRHPEQYTLSWPDGTPVA
jgi:hypothetical protein